MLNDTSPLLVAFAAALTADLSYVRIFRAIPPNGIGAHWMSAGMLARQLVLTHLTEHPRLYPKRKLVDEIAENFSRCLENDVFGVRMVTPLEGFQSSVRLIDLGQGLTIRKLSSSEMLHLFPLKSTLQFPSFGIWSHVIDFRAEYPISSPPEGWDRHGHEMRRAVHALRICQAGQVAGQMGKTVPLRPGVISMISGGNWSSLDKLSLFKASYHLRQRDVAKLRSIFTALGQPIPKSVKIACDRIRTSIERSSREDELIDHVVALEALFGDVDNTTGSMTYKIALRAAMFMRDTALERTKAFQLIKRVLAIRGKIVHGVTTLGNLKDADKEAVEFLGEFVRHSVTEILLKHPTFTRASADDHILSLPRPT